jgi:hypothetical protein
MGIESYSRSNSLCHRMTCTTEVLGKVKGRWINTILVKRDPLEESRPGRVYQPSMSSIVANGYTVCRRVKCNWEVHFIANVDTVAQEGYG